MESPFTIFPLEKIALIRIATILCNNQQLIDLITKCKFYKDSLRRLNTKNEKEFRSVEDKGNELISEIFEKGTFKKNILDLLWPVTYRIIRWKFWYAPTINNEFLCHFYWTDKGRIDHIRTGKYIITNEMISITKRFMLACNLCLNEEIRELRMNMAPEDDEYLLAENSGNTSPITKFYLHQQREDYLIEHLDELFEYAIEIGSIEAFKYIFSMLPEVFKSDTAVHCLDFIQIKLNNSLFLEEEEADILNFVVPQMTEENQIYFFSSIHRAGIFLSYKLYSPRPDDILEAWNDKSNFALLRDVQVVLSFIFHKFHFEIFIDHDYRDLFVRAWEKLSDSFKESIKTDTNLGVHCFCALVKDDFKFIFEQITSEIWKGLIASEPSKRDKWFFLHFLVEKELVTTRTLENKRDFVLSKFLKRVQFNSLIKLVTFVSDNIKKKEKQRRK